MPFLRFSRDKRGYENTYVLHTYQREGSDIIETEQLALTMTGQMYPRNWRSQPGGDADYFAIRKYVHAVLDRVGLQQYQVDELADARYAYGLQYTAGKIVLARFGSVSAAMHKEFDLRGEVMFAELNVDALFEAYCQQEIRVDTISRFPGIVRDLAFELPQSVRYAQLEGLIRKSDQEHLRSVELFDVYTNEEQLGKGRKSYAVQLVFEDMERTLTDAEVDASIKRIVAAVVKELDAKQR